MFRRTDPLKLRAIDTQIATLLKTIDRYNARLRRDGELSRTDAHMLNEYRVELIERRRARVALTAANGLGSYRRSVVASRISHQLTRETHVVVGDHDPEVRRTPGPEPRHADHRAASGPGKGPRPYHTGRFGSAQ